MKYLIHTNICNSENYLLLLCLFIYSDAVSRQSQISSSSGGGVAGVQLGSLSARGQFLPVQVSYHSY